MPRSASARSSVIHVHIVTSAFGKPSAGVVLHADASQHPAAGEYFQPNRK
jgi:hypothetical protein